jgi:hypothetical protein
VTSCFRDAEVSVDVYSVRHLGLSESMHDPKTLYTDFYRSSMDMTLV